MSCDYKQMRITKAEYAKQLKPRLTPEFLDTLKDCASYFGESDDFYEIAYFINQLHKVAEIEELGDDFLPFRFSDTQSTRIY